MDLALAQALDIAFQGAAGAAPRVSHFNPQHPAPIMVWGAAADHWWRAQAAADAVAEMLFAAGARLLVHAAGSALPPALAAAGLQNFVSDDSAAAVLVQLRQWRAARAPAATVHGVMLDIYGLGVLLSGSSGMGKSELALDLLSRGHRLIADDAVEIRRPGGGVLLASCPPLLRDFMEVRGLGVINIRRMFGDDAQVARQRLDLIVQLDNRHEAQQQHADGEAADRLSGRRRMREILGLAVPEICLRAKLGHNQRALVEAACRDHWLRIFGHAADEEFIARQQAAVDGRSE